MRKPAKFLGWMKQGVVVKDPSNDDTVFWVSEGKLESEFYWRGWLKPLGDDEDYWLFYKEEIELLDLDTPLEDFL